jgi:hypothetical protein
MKKTQMINFVIAIALVGSLLLGCQETPEYNAVPNKGESTLNDAIAAAPVEQNSLGAPETWQHKFGNKDGTIYIVVDASIELPETQCYPVARVKKVDLTETWLKDFILKLGNGSKVYEYKDETMYTKNEVEEIIINLKRQIADPNSDLNGANLSAESRSELIKEKEDEIKAWEEYYKVAPETFEGLEKEVKYSLNNTGRQQFSCSMDLGKENPAYISVSRTDEGGYVVISNHDAQVGEILYSSHDFENLDNIAMNVDQAITLGLDFLEDLGEKDFSASLILGGYLRDRNNPNALMEELPQCYHIYYTRSVEGVKTTYRTTNMDAFLMNGRMAEKAAVMEQYAPFWPQESVEMIITDSGIQHVRWEMPTQQAEMLNTNVQLLSFDEIQRIFETQMTIEGLWTNPADTGIISREIVITRIALGMMQIREKDTYDGLLMVPTWNFFGYETYTYAAPVEGGYNLDAENKYVNDQLAGHSFLTINAIDGSIINPVLGY